MSETIRDYSWTEWFGLLGWCVSAPVGTNWGKRDLDSNRGLWKRMNM